jgi:hypothetical protein
MSIFSKIKGAKKAAAEHKAKAEEKKSEATPYRHIPTHAGIDAFSTTPRSWQAEDRQAIQTMHRDRLSRNYSSYSASPIVSSRRSVLPRNNSSFSGNGESSSMGASMYRGNRPDIKRSSSSMLGPDTSYEPRNSRVYHGKSPLSSSRTLVPSTGYYQRQMLTNS